MNASRVNFLREYLEASGTEPMVVRFEFSYDDGWARTPHFFGVPDGEHGLARQLYLDWGGRREPGARVGTTARRPDREMG